MPSEPARVLVVDDQDENRNMLSRRLARLGYEVAQAEDGDAALALLAQGEWALVLLDRTMPGMDGHEVLRRIRESNSPGQLPVIMVTGRVGSEDVAESLRLGANDYVIKPVDMVVLQARMEAQLQRRAAEDLAERAMADMRRAMGQLEAARLRAEAAARAKSEFLANMSHEIRTPLNGVLGMAQVMAQGELAPAQRERLEIIRTAGEGLLGLLNDLLDLSKIEAGKVELEAAEFDLEGAVRGACAPFAPLAEGKGVDFVLDIAEDARGPWRSDPARLRQILSNLVSNAVKFTTEGEVRIKVQGEGDGRDAWLVTTVSDTGIGIPEDKLHLVFDKFAQADASTTRQFGGTGLGLAISRDLARLMGGQIEVQSLPGIGSSFTLRIPAHRLSAPTVKGPDAQPRARSESRSDGAKPLRVLAAEDNPTNQLVLAALLEAADVDLVLVPDGAKAVEAWSHEAFDIVLMDVQMPVMDGVSASKAIRGLEAERNQARTPIIAVTANAMAHQLQSYLAAGMDKTVSKPIQADLLYSAIAAAITDAAERARKASAA